MPEVVMVTLDNFETVMACRVGMARRLSSIQRRRSEPYGTPERDLWAVDIEAAAAEMAVAKVLGIYWKPHAGKPQTQPGDVGPVEVRSTNRPAGGLIVHERDSDDAPFVLVTVDLPRCRIIGWIKGEDAKRPAYWREDIPRPAFIVPQADLLGLQELINRYTVSIPRV